METALVYAKRFGNREAEGWHIGYLGSAYRDVGKIQKAIQCFGHGLIIYRELGDLISESSANSNLGNIFSDTGDYEKAIDFYKLAIAIDEKIDEKKGRGFISHRAYYPENT